MQHPILAKLINQAGCCCSFLMKTSKILKMKKIFCLEIPRTDRGGQFRVGKKDSGHKIHFFLWLSPFFGCKYSNLMTCSLRERGIFVMSFLLN